MHWNVIGPVLGPLHQPCNVKSPDWVLTDVHVQEAEMWECKGQAQDTALREAHVEANDFREVNP